MEDSNSYDEAERNRPSTEKSSFMEVIEPDDEESTESDFDYVKAKSERRNRKYKLSKDRLARKQWAAQPEARSECPECKLLVVRLNRHLKEQHGWSQERLTAIGRRKPKPKQKEWPCPICKKRFVRVDMHLLNFHKLRKTSKRYHVALTRFYALKDAKKQCVEEPRKSPQEAHDSPNPLPIAGTSSSPVASSSTTRQAPLSFLTDESESASSGNKPMSVDANSIIAKFEKWLKSFDGGSKPAGISHQHGQQAARIWRSVSKSYSLTDLLNPKRIKLWLTKRIGEKLFKSGTILSHTGSLKLFIEFLIDKRRVGEEGRVVINKLSAWNSTIRKSSKVEKWRRMHRQQKSAIKPSDITKIERSQIAETALKALEKKEKVEVPIYLDVVAYLALIMLLNTGQRIGSLTNMTIEEIRAAEDQIEEDNDVVVQVIQHKTSYEGPANVCMTREFFKLIMTYFEYLRPKTDDPRVFVRLGSGHGFSNTGLNQLINSRFQRLLGKRINSTIIRKSVTTTMWKVHPELSTCLARSMSHSERTAGEHYALPLARQECRMVASKIRSAMRGQTTLTNVESGDNPVDPSESPILTIRRRRRIVISETSSSEERESSTTPPPGVPAVTPSTEELESVGTKEHEVESPCSVVNPVLSETDMSPMRDPSQCPIAEPAETGNEDRSCDMGTVIESAEVKKGHKRRAFKRDQVDMLLRLCRHNIDNRLPLKQAEMINLLSDTDEGLTLLEQFTAKQLVDRIRAEIRTKNKKK